VALGLKAAHEERIVHRDIKSANILINDSNQVKLIDFGLAKLINKSELTLEGIAIGTVDYISPEQAQGDKVDHRTDIWALGVVLYEMITGQLPFRGDHAGTIINAILNNQPKSPKKIRTEIPFALEKIIDKAMCKDLSSRYFSINEMIKNLENLTDKVGYKTIPLSQLWYRSVKFFKILRAKKFNLKYLIIILSVLLLAFYVIIFLKQPFDSLTQTNTFKKNEKQRTLSVGRIYEVPDLPIGLIKPCFSPSGEFLSVVSSDSQTGHHILCLTTLDSPQLMPLTKDMDVRGPPPVFSPDSKFILFTSYHKDSQLGTIPDVWIIPTKGGQPKKFIEKASSADFSPDGESVVYAAVEPNGTALHILQPDGSIHKIVKKGYWPRWSPDGKWIAYSASNPEGGNGHLFIIHPDGSTKQRLTDTPSQMYGLCWTPDSKWIIYSSNKLGPINLWAVSINNKERYQLIRAPSDCDSPSVSPDGSRIIFSKGLITSRIYLSNGQGADSIQPVIEKNAISSVSLSPTGEKLAIVTGSSFIVPKLIIHDLIDHSETKINIDHPFRVKWTGYGDRLLVVTKHPELKNNSIWLVDLARGWDKNKKRIIKGKKESLDWVDLSPNGRYLVAARAIVNGYAIVLYDLESGTEKILATAPEVINLRWSPDGKRLCWSNQWRPADTGNSGIWIMELANKNILRITSDGSFPVWKSDSRTIIYARYHEFEGVWQISQENPKPKFLQPLPGDVKGYPIEDMDIAAKKPQLIMRFNLQKVNLYIMDDLKFE
jgi:Tol biopolymer transport system component